MWAMAIVDKVEGNYVPVQRRFWLVVSIDIFLITSPERGVTCGATQPRDNVLFPRKALLLAEHILDLFTKQFLP